MYDVYALWQVTSRTIPIALRWGSHEELRVYRPLPLPQLELIIIVSSLRYERARSKVIIF